jgi:hypothetical protein
LSGGAGNLRRRNQHLLRALLHFDDVSLHAHQDGGCLLGLLREAGGVVSDLQGQDSHALGGALIAASTRPLQNRIGIALQNPPDDTPKRA